MPTSRSPLTLLLPDDGLWVGAGEGDQRGGVAGGGDAVVGAEAGEQQVGGRTLAAGLIMALQHRAASTPHWLHGLTLNLHRTSSSVYDSPSQMMIMNLTETIGQVVQGWHASAIIISLLLVVV